MLEFAKLVNTWARPSCLSATKRRRSEEGWEKFGRTRKRDTMLPRMIAPSGKVGRTEVMRGWNCAYANYVGIGGGGELLLLILMTFSRRGLRRGCN